MYATALPEAEIVAARGIQPRGAREPITELRLNLACAVEEDSVLVGHRGAASVRSPAPELAEPEADRSAGAPVELALAVQYFLPFTVLRSRTNTSMAPFVSRADQIVGDAFEAHAATVGASSDLVLGRGEG